MKRLIWLILTGTTLAQDPTSTAGKIAFISDDDIQVMNADGSDMKNLTNNGDKRRESSPEWSPDRRRIAFEADDNIFVVDADGSNERQLTKTKFSHDLSRPVWAPDGKRIAYIAGPGLGNDLYVMDADGSNAKNLTNDKDHDHSPVWSPDGTMIAYVTQPAKEIPDGGTDYNTYDLAVVNADGSGKRKLTTGEAKEAYPVWSPDGRRLIFTKQVVLSKQKNVTLLANPDLWIMNADGSDPKNLTTNQNKGEDQWPTWSPDGGKIAFEARKNGGPSAVYVMDTNGSNVKALTEIAWGHEYHSLRWSPDGKRILLMDSYDKILVMGADGSGLAEVAKGTSPTWPPAQGKRPVFQVKSPTATAPAVMPPKVAAPAKIEPAARVRKMEVAVPKPAISASLSKVDDKAAREKVMWACETEIGILCNTIKENAAATLACLRRHEDDLFAPCLDQLTNYRAGR